MALEVPICCQLPQKSVLQMINKMPYTHTLGSSLHILPRMQRHSASDCVRRQINTHSFVHTDSRAKNSKYAERTEQETEAKQRTPRQYYSSSPIRSFFILLLPLQRGSSDVSRFLLHCAGSMRKRSRFRIFVCFLADVWL